MGRSLPSGSDERAARAFTRVGWKKLWTRLYRYATRTLRLAAIDAERAGVVEAVDLLLTLFEIGLSGRIAWTLPADATDEEITAYLCTKLYGLRANLRRDAARTVYDDELDERADGASDVPARLHARRGIAAAVRAVEHDAEASAHLGKMIEGKKRAEIAAELGCTVEHVDAVRKRIARGVAGFRATMNDNGEDEPPSSGPRGSHHEPQAAEERRGASPEPHRGARRAGRRR